MTSTSTADGQNSAPATEPFRGVIDWVVSLLLVLGGLLFASAGALVSGLADRADIAALVADGTIQSTELTDAELVDVSYAFLWWGGIGLLVAGTLLVLAGIGFFVLRRRQARRRQEAGASEPDMGTNAIVGAAVTALTAFVPFSPLLGGGIAGYLQRSDRMTGAKVGAFSGVVASVPLVVLFVFVITGFAFAAADLGLGLVAGVGAIAMVFALLLVVAYMAALGGLGGYLGVALTESRDRDPETV